MKLPYAKAGTSIANKTGQWRNFKPVVEESKCVKCGICIQFCPEGIMGVKGEVPDIDYDYCKGCALCAEECPQKAIRMELEKK